MSARKSISRLAVLGLWTLSTISFAGAVLADEPPRVLGASGTVYELHEGAYGDLFPDGSATNPGNPVLALDVSHPDGVQERWLVPGTENGDPDGSSTLVYEPSLGVYILWESRFNDLHPLLRLTSFDGTEWSEAIEIASGPFAIKGSPELVITREKGIVADSVDVTTLHITWWEESGGLVLKHYAPVFIRGGSYSGWTPVFDLAGFLPESAEEELVEVAGLERAVCLSPGRNERTIVAGFLDPNTHRLSTLEIEVLPQALGHMADELRGYIVVSGITAPAELAQSAVEKMFELGSPFHEATLGYMAGEVHRIIESAPADLDQDGIQSIADELRGYIVIAGAEFGPDGLATAGDPQIVEISQSPESDGPYQYLKVTVVSDRVAPEVDGTAELILSESGRSVIVTWEAETHVYYRQSLDDGWTEVRSIELTEDLDSTEVRKMLEEYVRAE